jgi:hypothetical protein
MSYGDLLKLDCQENLDEPNPCRKVYGKGPDGKRCKQCVYIYAKSYSKTYYKCAKRPDTNGPATDHRVNWFACAKFEEPK